MLWPINGIRPSPIRVISQHLKSDLTSHRCAIWNRSLSQQGWRFKRDLGTQLDLKCYWVNCLEAVRRRPIRASSAKG